MMWYTRLLGPGVVLGLLFLGTILVPGAIVVLGAMLPGPEVVLGLLLLGAILVLGRYKVLGTSEELTVLLLELILD